MKRSFIRVVSAILVCSPLYTFSPTMAQGDDWGCQVLVPFESQGSYAIEWHALPSESLFLGLYRNRGALPYTDDEAAVLLSIRKHLMLAGRTAYQLSLNRVAGTIAGLDIAGMVAVFTDRHGKVTHGTEAASEIMGPHLQVIDGELWTCHGFVPVT